MEPRDDRIARRLGEIRAEEAALEAETAERTAGDDDPGGAVVGRQRQSGLRSAAFLIGVVVLAAGLLGVAVTLSRLAGRDADDADRLGWATVTSCVRHGPVTNMGFGYWDGCTAAVTWDDGDSDRITVGAVFTSADVGGRVRVGDLGDYRSSKELARADAPYRPWLAWVGYAAGIVALVPLCVGVVVVRGLLRVRRR